MKRILIACLLTVSLFGAGLLGNAADASGSAKPEKSEKRVKQMPFRGKVTAVDKTTKTLTLAGKEKQRVFRLTSETRIHNDGQPAVLDDVRAGAMVGGRAKENSSGEWEVVVLNLGIKGAKAPAEEKEPMEE